MQASLDDINPDIPDITVGYYIIYMYLVILVRTSLFCRSLKKLFLKLFTKLF